MTHHVQGSKPNFLIFSTPRSGSTWLAELLATQGRFKIVNEPFNLRKEVVRDHLGLENWQSLFEEANRGAVSRYMKRFIEGTDSDRRFPRERPFSQFWHPRTDRVIFKILFAGEDSFSWFQNEFRGHTLFLVRHPLAVSLSRRHFPRLESFLSPPFSRHFSATQLKYANALVDSGDKLQIAVLDWCLQNMVPLQNTDSNVVTIFYEHLVMKPELIVNDLARKFDLPDRERMLDRINKPSRSTRKSRREYHGILFEENEMRKQRLWLIERWRDKIQPAQEQAAFQTLETFGIDCYEIGRALPNDRHLRL